MNYDFDTRCIHGNGDFAFHDSTKAVSFPIYQTATFEHISLGHSTGFDYTRESNPTRQRLEEIVSSLENADDTIAFSSGMAAITACFELFSPGDHILCSQDLYGGVIRLFDTISRKNGLKIDQTDTSDLNRILAGLTPQTKALYIETPSNPMMNVTDLRSCARLAHEHGLLLIVDNTFLSPCLQNPLSLGADLVIHSGSKFLSGHNDAIAGFVCTASPELSCRIHLIAKTTGGVLAPFDCWLIMRGIKTLAIRVERQQETALKLASWLKEQPWVREVLYVGLPEHPGYAVNRSQTKGAGSMISFRTDSAETARRLLNSVKLITFAESLGGTETLLTYPMVQTHHDVPEEIRERLGITDTLLRMSVGLEAPEDLIADLKQAWEAGHEDL